MGADLITIGGLVKNDTVLNPDAGHDVVPDLVYGDIEPTALENMSYLVSGEESEVMSDEFKNVPLSEEYRDLMHTAIDGLMDTINGRSYADWSWSGYTIMFIGETSWGDTPFGFDEWQTVIHCKPVSEAMGFIWEWPEACDCHA